MAGFEKKVLEVTWPTAAMKRGVTMVDVRPVHLDRKLIGSLPRGATYSAADPHRTPGSCDSNRKLHPQVESRQRVDQRKERIRGRQWKEKANGEQYVATRTWTTSRRETRKQAAQCLMCEGAGSFSTVCPHQPIQPMVIPGLHARELGGGMEGGDEGGSQWDACPGTRREGGAGSWDVPDKSETLPWGRSWRSGRQTGQNTTNE
eukprot:CAMPEP_0119479938 /NCGR_PEP_ID=MMETSP1344-20130328/8981_1 /TAXON_ID=236787 /ORGANISM="Florenciella parvula, Strain CCMP2471" /LENGTH=203 /DNA_ID=CAMNT_0007514215 /DNA_START=16 /DNA_END=627 /DNA_ORIENTATION=+